MNRTGKCIYCGQINYIDCKDDATEEEKDKLATEICTCEKAKAAREKMEEASGASENIKELFQDNPAVEEIFTLALKYIQAGEITEIMVKTGKQIRGKMRITAKETIRVERIENKKKARETENQKRE